MLTRNFIFLLFIVVAASNCQSTPAANAEKAGDSAQPTTPAGEDKATQLYIHAGKGVVLRATPSPTGAKVATLAYGTKVEAKSLATTGPTYVAERVGPYQLAGKWLKVSTADGQEGYVFERYAFPFPTHRGDYGQLTYFEWFYQQFAPQANIEISTTDSTSFQEGAIDGRTTIFDDGAEYEFAMFEGGVSEYLRIPASKMTIEEALVIFRAAHFRDEKNITTSYDETLKSIFVNGEISAVQIQKKDGFIEIAIHVS